MKVFVAVRKAAKKIGSVARLIKSETEVVKNGAEGAENFSELKSN